MTIQHRNAGVFQKSAIATAISGALAVGAPGIASAQDEVIEEIIVAGIRGSLTRAKDIKREAVGVVDSISAEDVGKFPDLNVAESLQRVTGVSIDRSGGEGQAVTVRGFGPQFNTVLVNGRQIANDSGGREFNFDVLSADLISGADVYKSGRPSQQEGGIGATINISTARPFDRPGFHVTASLKGMYESLSEETSPQAAVVIGNTFDDDRFGVLFSASYQERDVQINGIGTAGWRPGQTISNVNDGVLFSNAYIPRNWDQTIDQQARTRTNANLVLQFAPNEDVTITVDGFVSQFEVDSLVTDLASWFEPDRVGSGTLDSATNTLVSFSQEIGLNQGSGDPASDFVSTTRNSRDVTNNGFGFNVEWAINDQLTAEFDAATSSAENDRAGRDRFNVVGIINNYTFDGTGGIPTVQHDGFSGSSLPDASLSRLHYNEKGNVPSDEDEISEFKVNFEYLPDTDVFQKASFGAYMQDREKSNFQIFASQCAFCGYGTPAPNSTINFRPFTAQNFFPGLIDTFYTYDGDAYVQFLADSGNPIQPTLQNNRYTINEDIISLYFDFEFGLDIGDMPLTIGLGARYAQTDIDVSAVQSFISDVVPTTDLTLFSNRFGPATNINEGGSYSNLLPSFSAKLDIQDDMVLRFLAYDSLTRATMSQLSPATTFNEPRRQNLTASGGNPALEPFQSTNWDMSFEWYYTESSFASFAVFNKEVDEFIVRLTGEETYTMTDRSAVDNFRCSTANEPNCAPGVILDPNNPTLDVVGTTEELNGAQEIYTVTRPRNSDAATVTGYEAAITHIWDNGFGVAANATIVDSDSDTLEGLGNSQNLIVFYETDRWQARVAYNNREGFLRLVDNGFNGEPVNTETFGQWDISGSYDINENVTVFFEGINITEEELIQTGRFANQIYNIQDNGSRFAIGARVSF
ncbi:MAG: TonB-dependent receptor [Gammaproteobacteria bacterium]|nr:TonB-dependent receptor [Gammaproteobacteria bacterium]